MVHRQPSWRSTRSIRSRLRRGNAPRRDRGPAGRWKEPCRAVAALAIFRSDIRLLPVETYGPLYWLARLGGRSENQLRPVKVCQGYAISDIRLGFCLLSASANCLASQTHFARSAGFPEASHSCLNSLLVSLIRSEKK